MGQRSMRLQMTMDTFRYSWGVGVETSRRQILFPFAVSSDKPSLPHLDAQRFLVLILRPGVKWP